MTNTTNTTKTTKTTKSPQVTTRFPPEPSGYLHLGHIKAIYNNYIFAKKNNGCMLMRFDDTNPKNYTDEYKNAIIEDLTKIAEYFNDFGFLKNITCTSSYFDIIYKYMLQLIENGKAYVDTLDQETLKYNRDNSIESKNRSLSPEENLNLLNSQNNGMALESAESRQNYVRLKLDMHDKNPCMRDPVIYRYIDGKPLKLYPTYDFACPIVDSIEGVTHAFRTNEYSDRTDLYLRILHWLNLRKPILRLYSSLNMENSIMSKRKIKKMILNKEVSGWDDPRLPTLRGLMKRGMLLETIMEFMKGQYMTKKINNMSWDKIWSLNNKKLDKIVPRYTAINTTRMVELKLTNLQLIVLSEFFTSKIDATRPGSIRDRTSSGFTKMIPLLRNNAELGEKTIYITPTIYMEYNDMVLLNAQDEVSLFNFGNVTLEGMDLDNLKGEAEILDSKLPNYRKSKYILSWLSKYNSATIDIIEYDNMKPYRANCLVDKDVLSLKPGTICQLVRRGYFIMNDDMKLIKLPDYKKKKNHLSIIP